jgi:hypothetical protein
MQPWQIKALQLEVAALNHLDGFMREHALYFLTGAIYLLLALLAWVLSGGLRPRIRHQPDHVQPVVIIHWSPPPPEPEDFNLFPPHSSAQCDCEQDDWD